VANGRSVGDSWNDVLVEVVAVSRAHSVYIMVKSFVTTLEKEVQPQHPKLYPVLKRLCDLFGEYQTLPVLLSCYLRFCKI
jgi:acyl-CoA oxidase